MYLVINTIAKQSLVALGEDNKIVDKISWQSDYRQSEELLVKIDELFERNKIVMTGDISKCHELDGIVVVNGPGSYTGIRVGVATGNALGFTLKIPVVGMTCLDILANYAASQVSGGGEIVALVKSIADKYYYGVYKSVGEVKLIGDYGNAEFGEILSIAENPVCLVGEDVGEKIDKDVEILEVDCFSEPLFEVLAKMAGDRLKKATKDSLCTPEYINKPHITLPK